MQENLDFVWLSTVNEVLYQGLLTKPRGQLTREVPHRTTIVDMRYPVLTIPERKLSYRFMAAEAYWILSGDDRVETIAPYNKNISQFSDDGKTFYGAYGPKIRDQLRYVVEKLKADPDTRQAGLTIWRENPIETKDVPCTIAIWFQRRHNKLITHVFMRSSDVWLGLPYDTFNFSMLSHLVCGHMNQELKLAEEGSLITPGALYLTAASCHLYQRDWLGAKRCLEATALKQTCEPTPDTWFMDPRMLMQDLAELRLTKRGDAARWWEGEDHG